MHHRNHNETHAALADNIPNMTSKAMDLETYHDAVEAFRQREYPMLQGMFRAS